jgi:hypothetical protein
MSRIDKEGVVIRESVIAESNVYQQNILVLGATLTLGAGSPPLQFLDANGVARTVNLPPNVKGGFMIIYNTAAGAFALTVKDNTSVSTIGSVAQGKCAMFICDGTAATTAWKVFLGA